MKKLVSIMLSALLAAGMFAGCGSGGSEPSQSPADNGGSAAASPSSQAEASKSSDGGKIVLWTWPNQGNMDVFSKYAVPKIKEATGKDLEIIVKPQEGGAWSAYLNVCVAALASGEVPDIISSAVEGHQFLLSKNVMEPLDDFIANDPEGKALVDSFVPLALDAFKSDGKQYQIPFSLEMMAIWYNLDMFKAAGIEPIDPKTGWTWEEFTEIAQKLTKEENGNKVYGAGLNLGAAFYDMPWYLTNGAAMMTDDLKAVTFNTPEFAQSISYLNDLINKYGVCPVPDPSSQMTMQEMFKAERVAMTNIGGWAVAGMLKDMPGKYGIAPWPKPTGGAANPSTVYGMCCFAIYNQSPNKQDAWEAIKILSSEEMAEKLWTEGGQSPAVASLLSGDIAKTNYPVGLETWDVITENMKVISSPIIFPEIEKIYNRNLYSVFNGQQTAEDAAAAMQSEAEKLL